MSQIIYKNDKKDEKKFGSYVLTSLSLFRD